MRWIDVWASSVIIWKIYQGAISKVLRIALILILVVGTTHHLIVLHHNILLYNLSLVSVVSRLACVTSWARSIGSIVGTFSCCWALLFVVCLSWVTTCWTFSSTTCISASLRWGRPECLGGIFAYDHIFLSSAAIALISSRITWCRTASSIIILRIELGICIPGIRSKPIDCSLETTLGRHSLWIRILSSLRLLRSGIRSEVQYLACVRATWSRSPSMIRKELLLAQVHCILIVVNSKTIGLAQIRLTPLSMSRLFSNRTKYIKLIKKKNSNYK